MDLLKDDVKKVFRKYFFAAIGSSLVTSVYSFVDSVAIGQYEGPNGAAALVTVQGIWTILVCLGILFGVGGGIKLSERRGAGKTEEANQYFSATLITSIGLVLAITVLFAFFRDKIILFSGADEILLPYAMRYSKWITAAVPAFLMGIVLGDFNRNDGDPNLPTVAVIVGGISNIIGDYLFVFALDMGMEGAGIATCIGQYVSLFINLSHYFSHKCQVRFSWPKEYFKRIGAVISAGASPCVVDVSYGVMVLLFNNQIRIHAGNAELAVFGVVSNLAILFQASFYGVGRAIQPLASVNTGAKQHDRAKQTLWCWLSVSLIMGLVFTVACELFPEFFLKLMMDVTPDVLAIGPAIFQVYASSFVLLGVNVVMSYYLQAILHSKESLILSVFRGLIFSVSFILLLPAVFDFSAIWWSMALTEICTTVLGFILLKRTEKNTR